MGNKCIRGDARAKFCEDEGELEGQQQKAEVDWSDERDVNRRSAMNSLHNYAIGKMDESEDSDSNSKKLKKRSTKQRNSWRGSIQGSSFANFSNSRKCKNQKTKKNQGISFADTVVSIYLQEMEPVDFESQREGSGIDCCCSQAYGSNSSHVLNLHDSCKSNNCSFHSVLNVDGVCDSDQSSSRATAFMIKPNFKIDTFSAHSACGCSLKLGAGNSHGDGKMFEFPCMRDILMDSIDFPRIE
jgi:hypothetical protein